MTLREACLGRPLVPARGVRRERLRPLRRAHAPRPPGPAGDVAARLRAPADADARREPARPLLLSAAVSGPRAAPVPDRAARFRSPKPASRSTAVACVGVARTPPADEPLPDELAPRKLLRRFLVVLALLGALVLVALLAPGLGQVRELLGRAAPGWIALAVAFEALSCVSYVLMFRPIFCPHMPWRTSSEIGWPSSASARSCPPAAPAGSRSAPGSCSRGRHAGRPDRAPLGRVLPDQELGQLRRRRGARHADGASACSGRDRSLLADGRCRPRCRVARDRRSCSPMPRLGPGRDPAPGTRAAAHARSAPRAGR